MSDQPSQSSQTLHEKWRSARLVNASWLLYAIGDAMAEALAQAERERINPGVWVCQACGFQVVKCVLRASDGAVGIDTREVQDICPNDGTSLRPQTWKEAADEANRNALAWMTQAEEAAAAIVRAGGEIDKCLARVHELSRILAGDPPDSVGAYLIWSFEHQAWWGPAECGYTEDLVQAGHYTQAEADRLVARANVKQIQERAMRVTDALVLGPPGRTEV